GARSGAGTGVTCGTSPRRGCRGPTPSSHRPRSARLCPRTGWTPSSALDPVRPDVARDLEPTPAAGSMEPALGLGSWEVRPQVYAAEVGLLIFRRTRLSELAPKRELVERAPTAVGTKAPEAHRHV